MLERCVSRVFVLVVFLVAAAGFALAQDDWLGGTGNWSNGALWSGGVPVPADNVLIYSGGNDNVTLDVNATIDSLTLGGASNGTTSELTDGGVAHTLNITTSLTVGQTGVLYLYGGSTVTANADSSNAGAIVLYNGSTVSITGNLDNQRAAYTGGGGSQINVTGTLTNEAGAELQIAGSGDSASIGTLVNNGSFGLANGASLNLTNQPGGITDVVAGSVYSIAGTFTAGLKPAFANLTSIEGTAEFVGQNDNIAPNGGTLTLASGGLLSAGNGSTLTINGNASNSGLLATAFTGGGGNTLTITGALINSGNFTLYGFGDKATLGGGLVNSGYVYVLNDSTLQINGNVTNSGQLETQPYFGGGGNTVTITGTLTTNSGSQFNLTSPGDVANVGTLNNSGSVFVNSGTTLNLTSQPNGITDVVAGSSFFIQGIFNAGANSAFANLTSIEGQVGFYGQNDTITPNAGTLTLASGGLLNPATGSTVTINGNVNNSGFVTTGYYGSGGNTLTITGTLTNHVGGQLLLFGDDMATMAGLANSAFVYVEAGSTLTISGDVTNSALLSTGYYLNHFVGGNTLTITGNLTNSGAFLLLGPGDTANVATLNNSGTVFVNSGATLNLTNQPGGITDVVAGSTFRLAGTFTAGPNNGFYQLTSVEGNLILANAQTTTTTPIGGTFTVGNTGYVEVKTGTTFNIDGSVTVNSGGIFSVNDPFPTTVNITGMLTNLGGQVNVVGPNAFLNVGGIGNGGMLTLPEGSTLNVANGFYQLASGTLGEAIGASGFAIISVNGGLVMLDGTLDVLLDSGYDPAVGSMFKFFLFDPGALSGTFASIQNDIFNGGAEKWVVMYNDAGGYVELEAVNATPEPASLLLLGSGLLTIGYGARRRLMK